MNIFESSIEKLKSYCNTEFLGLNAMLVIKHGDRPYLISKNKEVSDSFKIYIDYKNLEDVLLNNIGCLVGGDKIYYDEVLLDGVLKYDDENEILFFSEISKFLLIRDEIVNILDLKC